MSRVVQFDETTMTGLSTDGLARLLVEFDEHGHILREIGIDPSGQIAHRFPGSPTLDEYGLMGPNVIGIAGENSSPRAILIEVSHLVPLQIFEELWASN